MSVDPKVTERHLVWLCAGCEGCAPTDGRERMMTPCTDQGPSTNGAWVVRLEDYERVVGERDRRTAILEDIRAELTHGQTANVDVIHRWIDGALL
jgi:hypothetical protein